MRCSVTYFPCNRGRSILESRPSSERYKSPKPPRPTAELELSVVDLAVTERAYARSLAHKNSASAMSSVPVPKSEPDCEGA